MEKLERGAADDERDVEVIVCTADCIRHLGRLSCSRVTDAWRISDQ